MVARSRVGLPKLEATTYDSIPDLKHIDNTQQYHRHLHSTIGWLAWLCDVESDDVGSCTLSGKNSHRFIVGRIETH